MALSLSDHQPARRLALIGAAGVVVLGGLLLLHHPQVPSAPAPPPTPTPTGLRPAATRARQGFDGASPGVPLLAAPGDSSPANTVVRVPFGAAVDIGPATPGPCPADWQAQPGCGNGAGNTYYRATVGPTSTPPTGVQPITFSGWFRQFDLAF